jgi:hypothetical protein
MNSKTRKMTENHHHLGHVIMLCLARLRLTGMAAAELIGISQSGLVRLIAGSRRPDPDTLKTLTHATLWGDDTHAGYQLMIGHLMDELERAGWRADDIMMRRRGSRRDAMRALHEIEEHISAGDEAVAELIAHIADILRRADREAKASTSGPGLPMAAEEHAGYPLRDSQNSEKTESSLRIEKTDTPKKPRKPTKNDDNQHN